MIRIFKCFATMSLLLAAGTTSSAQTTVRWPDIISPATSSAQCDQLDMKYIELNNMLDRAHSQCIQKVGPAPTEGGRTCSRANCQQLHDLLYTQLEQRRSFAVNSCRKQVAVASQQCLGRIANQQRGIETHKSAIEDRYRSYCIGVAPNTPVGRNCAQLQGQIAADERAESTLIDRQHSECK